MEIVRDMEKACPQAWFINFTNPMIRICDADQPPQQHQGGRFVPPDFYRLYDGRYRPGKDLGIEVPEGITGMQADIQQAVLHNHVKEQIVPRVDIRAPG